MTDKLYCPWCGEELSNDFGVIFCYNEVCEIYGCELNERVIRDIIDGKKAQEELDRTRKALDVAVERLKLIKHETFQGEPSGINMGFHVRAESALADINEITKQEE